MFVPPGYPEDDEAEESQRADTSLTHREVTSRRDAPILPNFETLNDEYFYTVITSDNKFPVSHGAVAIIQCRRPAGLSLEALYQLPGQPNSCTPSRRAPRPTERAAHVQGTVTPSYIRKTRPTTEITTFFYLSRLTVLRYGRHDREFDLENASRCSPPTDTRCETLSSLLTPRVVHPPRNNSISSQENKRCCSATRGRLLHTAEFSSFC